MRVRTWDTVSLSFIAAAAGATALVYDRLPDPIPTHFDIHGVPDGWMPRAVGAWLTPGLTLVIWALVRFVRKILPAGDKARIEPGLMAFVSALLAAFLSVVHAVVLYVALSPGAPIMRIVLGLTSLVFVALGLVMPRTRRNPVIGIRTAWTLTSDENWARTHRVAGYAMVMGGLAAALATLGGGIPGAVFAVLCILGSAIVPVVYSLVLARRQNQRS